MIPRKHPDTVGFVWITHEEICHIVETLPSGCHFVEIGTANGSTARLIAMHRPDVHITCVDNFLDHRCEPQRGIPASRIERWLMNRLPNMNLFVGTFQELTSLMPRKWDAIFVDGGHLYHEVMADLMTSELHLNEKGIVYAHDYHEAGHPDVTRAVDDWCNVSHFLVARTVGNLAHLEKKI